jgi:hypothetical protein
VESLEDKLRRLGVNPRTLEFVFYRVRVPPGQETWKVTYLQFFYKHAFVDALAHGKFQGLPQAMLGRSDYQFTVQPNHLLSVATSSSPAADASFQPSAYHPQYKAVLGLAVPPPPTGTVSRVTILDTGVRTLSHFKIADRKNFVDNSKATDVTDDHGHGTAVATIITDLSPSTEVIVYKVADRNGVASEWDTLAALAARSDAHVINISLAFGLGERVCSKCGRQSHSSRSAVFENMIGQFDTLTPQPITVAAAGNDGNAELTYPARFGNVVAVVSVDAAKQSSSFSNYGEFDHVQERHRNIFAAPGGQVDKANPAANQYVGSAPSGSRHYWGTSFAAAYASGLIAELRSTPPWKGRGAADVLAHLKSTADQGLPRYDARRHGHGLIQFKP